MDITLSSIREARERIHPYIRKTPFLPFEVGEKELFLKCETLQRTGSFKIRGAANCILQNLTQARKSGVVAASAGNHAQGVAAMCRALGIRATIVMPTITPPIKVQNTQKWGANIELVGQVYDESFEHAMKLASSQGFVFIHPFRDPHVMAGQGTIGLELVEDPAFEPIEAVVMSVGGGGLSTGIATALRALKPNLKLYGVGAMNSPATCKAFHSGKVVEEMVKYTLAEGVSTKRADGTMLDLLKKNLDDFFAISEESIAHAISVFAESGKMIVEGAGALPLAAVLEGKIPANRVALVLSGANIDIPVLYHVLQRELVAQGRNVRLNITVSDRPGGLHSITQILAEQGANILQVFHQRASMKTGIGETEIEVDLETRGEDHTKKLIQVLIDKGFQVQRAA
jgi:threonine dehydratase